MYTSLPAEPLSARRARSFVTGALEQLGIDEVADTATLLVSELVTNAMLHAGGELLVRVSDASDPGAVRVEVGDGSSRAPRRQSYGPEAVTGRGMVLVDALADSWGCEVGPDGKVVWFELSNPVAA